VAEVKRAFRFAVIGLLLSSAPALAEDDLSTLRIRKLLEELRTDGQVRIGAAFVSSSQLLPEFYARRDFRKAWTNPQAIADLMAAAEQIHREGLDPQDYHLDALRRLRARMENGSAYDAQTGADLDILLTDSLARMAAHLLFGKVDRVELESRWNLQRDIGEADPADAMQRLIDSGQVATEIEHLRPKDEFYERLRAALDRYRKIGATGGWSVVDSGPSLKRGTQDARVGTVRQRLRKTGDVAGDTADEQVFDSTLRQGVIRFQTRHHLTVDGVVGPQTLAAMNVPAATRIDQIRVNLERARWLLQEDLSDFIIVDTAGRELVLFRKDERVWSTRVRVAKPYRRTPEFASAVNRLVLNPAWTVPPSALRDEILSAARQDPGYLTRKNIEVIDSKGSIVATESIDWAGGSRANSRYQLRQKPGPDNALGRIKFDFPNPHLVYLHAAPDRDLFRHSKHSFSSGSIRVENPRDLAVRLMEGDERWPPEALEQAVDSGSTQIVRLRAPFTVLLLYRTVAVDENGTVSFRPDIFRRDEAVLGELNSRFRHPNSD
jgi:murein L,D-transpeptidase YcbB/YkuD